MTWGLPVPFGDLAALDLADATPLSWLAVLLTAAYLAGVLRLRAQGRHWPALRTVAFVAGCVLLAVTSATGLEHYGTRLFSVFMFQQLTLMIAVPPLLVLGSPGTLLLRATPHGGAGGWVLRGALSALRSGAARWSLHPAVTICLFLLAYYGLYFGGIAQRLLEHPGGHLLLEAVFLFAGVVFTLPVLSTDPLPVRQSYGGRAIDVFVEMGLHAFFGVIVMMSATLFVPAFADSTRALGFDPLTDQGVAGGLAWGYGEAPTLILLLIVMSRWFRDDARRAARATRRAVVEGDPELDAYNAYLARLAAQEADGPARG